MQALMEEVEIDVNKIMGVAWSRAFENVMNKWLCGPIDGGCLVLAQAVQKYLGRGELYGMAVSNSFPPRTSLNHVALKVGDYYIDAFGVNTWDDLCEAWWFNEGAVISWSEPVTVQECVEAHFLHSDDMVQAVLSLF